MHPLIRSEDLKTLVLGAAVVAVAGLMLGAIAHPDLGGETGAEGPQILVTNGGARDAQTIRDPGVGVYAGQVPEYVIGADWTRPRAEPVWRDSEPEPEPEPEAADDRTVGFSADGNPAQVQVTHTARRDEPRRPAAFPSTAGGVTYVASPPTPPGADEPADGPD